MPTAAATRGVIFDMDGVIADTQRIHARIESAMLGTLGVAITPDEISRRFAGRSNKNMFAEVFGERGLESPYCEEISDKIFQQFCACSSEFVGIEGTIETIRALYGEVPLAVASASRPVAIQLVLTTVGVRKYFSETASSREVKLGKPAPDVFLLAAKKLGVKPKNCTVIEDGVSGMLGARAAGMRCVALAPDGRTDFPADIVVKDLRNIPVEWLLQS